VSTNDKTILDAVRSSIQRNPGLKFIAVHGIVDGKCTCGKSHTDPKEVGKHPVHMGWQDVATDNLDVIEGWFQTNPNFNLGLACKQSGIMAIDVDPRSGGHVAIKELERKSDYNLVPTVSAITGEYKVKGRQMRGSHYLYRCSPDESFFGNLKKQGLGGIDIKHNGYIVISPSSHFSEVKYEWEHGKSPWELSISEAPDELLGVLRSKPLTSKSISTTSLGNEESFLWKDLIELSGQTDRVDIPGVLREGLVEGERAVEIYKLACALANKFGTDEVSRTVIEDFMVNWNSRNVSPPLEVNGSNGLLMHVRRAIDFVRNNPTVALPAGSMAGETQQLAGTNDTAMVEWLAQFVEKEFCWTKSRGWLRFSEGFWDSRSDEHLLEFLRSFLRDFWLSTKANDLGVGVSTEIKSLLSASKLRNYELLLRGKLEVLEKEFNRKHDYLNVKNGVVDLRTGQLSPHDPKDYFTKICTVGYFPDAKHVDFDKALLAIPDYARNYVNVFLGQACTGWVAHEDYILLFLGGGRNGKSTIVHLPRIVLGDFAVQVSERILSSRDGDHTTDLTDLYGRRLAILEEYPNSGVNSKRLKDISGTAQISARRMRENNFTWAPTHSFIVTSNFEPQVNASDDGTWRRLVKLDFPYRYVSNPLLDNERHVELGLRDRLHQGLTGQHEAVLAWLVAGAMKWYSNGKRLESIPLEMQESIKEWRQGQDKIGTFLEENLEVNPASCVAFDDLYNFYKVTNSEDIGTVGVKEFAISTRSSEFFQSNGLKSGRKRTASLSISRPACELLPLPVQATVIVGVAIKNS